ncbi:uridine kinase [Weeksellaceae bacterium KMM 9713]|uniref:Uridine kinase n=1 Tax=Profundicola chukchiensis TaxID=2961959 RepID=A0A9X4MWL4_9FLAO|nr:uridine kinase [Profundicola chukchiensis]MDG4946223.1 uridine kinase [Profundicola chukchiensis]MDG4949672.1 uridine kinase [Profundicola chukchiensis]
MLIIGIAGGTGSGKTTVVHNILNQLSSDDVIVISQDNYYHDSSHLSFEERIQINFDHPRSIDFELLVEDLKKLKRGETIEQPVYSFLTHTRTDETLVTPPKNVVIVEGILVLTDAQLREMFDLKIYVHADSDERLIRRIKRDIQDRGRDLEEVISRYKKTLKPMHEQFIEPTKKYADLIIPNEKKKNDVAIDVMTTVIKNRLISQK